MRLRDICEIQGGLTVRERLASVEIGGVPAIQLRDVPPSGRASAQPIGRYLLAEVPKRYWAAPGDVLFRSRGENNTAVLVDQIVGEPAVALLPFIILRPNHSLADPRYIAWFINQRQTQRYFDKCARGTGIRMIPMNCLADVAIALPDLATQRAISEIDALARREQELVIGLAEMNRNRISLALFDRAQKPSPRLSRKEGGPTTGGSEPLGRE